MPLRSAGGSHACSTVSESAAPIAAVAQHGHGARGTLRASPCGGGPAPASGRIAAPEQSGRPALPMRRAATGLRRRVCPILVLVNRLQKEHPP
ncbi:hypothetical protein CO661_27065 [Sinorhizobium fredii]|uniref:Uncharacterized protein n=1 Tax=Rhizobium fredii TaxID=380 RepID=A0A2A6LQB5_RHIFR|nr:hypothetical protein CO661_27065 [Sinorhizobium fredii]